MKLQLTSSNPCNPENIDSAFCYSGLSSQPEEDDSPPQPIPSVFNISQSTKTMIVLIDKSPSSFVEENDKLYFRINVDRKYFFPFTKSAQKLFIPKKKRSKSCRRENPKSARPEDLESGFISSRLNASLPPKFPVDHHLLIGTTLNVGSFIFGILMKRDKKSFIIKCANPTFQNIRFDFQVGVTQNEDTFIFQEFSNTFSFITSERMVQISNKMRTMLNDGGTLMVDISMESN